MIRFLLILVISVPYVFSYGQLSIGGHSTVGESSSGGGWAVVCRDSQGSISSVELLDIYEAQHKFHFLIPKATQSMLQDYKKAVKNTYHLQSYKNGTVGIDEQKDIDAFFKMVSFTKPGEKLERLNDFGQTVQMPSACELEPLAIYRDDTNVIEVDTSLWAMLDSLNQAALMSHEFFYRNYRELGDLTSEDVRSFVAHIYSQNSATPVLKNVNLERSQFCSTRDTFLSNPSPNHKNSFFFREYDSDKNQFYFYFTQLMGRVLVSSNKATLVLKGHGPERVKIHGTQSDGWEVEMTLLEDSIKTGFYRDGFLVEEAISYTCQSAKSYLEDMKNLGYEIGN